MTSDSEPPVAFDFDARPRGQFREPAVRDEAAGLYRHVHFIDHVRRELDSATSEHREFSLVAIELDAPDSRLLSAGNAARERVLHSLGQLLQSNTRAVDAACRLGDQRFAVLLSGVGLATAHSRMDGLRRQCMGQVISHDGEDLKYTVSMGIASFPHTASDQQALLHAADKALAVALAKGNHVSLASIALQREP